MKIKKSQFSEDFERKMAGMSAFYDSGLCKKVAQWFTLPRNCVKIYEKKAHSGSILEDIYA